MTRNFSLTIHNQYEDLQKLCETASEFLESRSVPFGAAYAADLVLEEMTSNIIKYGYDDKAAHEINIQLAIENDSISIIIEDDGHPFDPTAVPPPDTGLSLEDRKIGGLGIHLVRNTSESMKYRRDDNRNILEVRLPIKPAPEEQDKNGT